MKIAVDFAAKCGRTIKPLHGINNSPIALYKPLPELLQAGIPYIRLHDAGGAYGGNCYVDIPNIFPDFDADENDPASYRFEFTDAYFKQLVASGMKIFYRLGIVMVQSSGGLVGKNQPWSVDQCPADCHSLLLTSGKGTDWPGSKIVQLEFLKQSCGLLLGILN